MRILPLPAISRRATRELFVVPFDERIQQYQLTRPQTASGLAEERANLLRYLNSPEHCNRIGILETQANIDAALDMGLIPIVDVITLEEGLIPSDTIKFRGVRCISLSGLYQYLDVVGNQGAARQQFLPALPDGTKVTRDDMFQLGLDPTEYAFFNSDIVVPPPPGDLNLLAEVPANANIHNIVHQQREVEPAFVAPNLAIPITSRDDYATIEDLAEALKTALRIYREQQLESKTRNVSQALTNTALELREFTSDIDGLLQLAEWLPDEELQHYFNLEDVPEEIDDPFPEEEFPEFVDYNANDAPTLLLDLVIAHWNAEPSEDDEEDHDELIFKVNYLLNRWSCRVTGLPGVIEHYQYSRYEIGRVVAISILHHDAEMLGYLKDWVETREPEVQTRTRPGDAIPLSNYGFPDTALRNALASIADDDERANLLSLMSDITSPYL